MTIREALPSSRAPQRMAVLVPGVTTARQDVGGILYNALNVSSVLTLSNGSNGDVAPIRVLGGPDAGLRLGRVTVDPINNVRS